MLEKKELVKTKWNRSWNNSSYRMSPLQNVKAVCFKRYVITCNSTKESITKYEAAGEGNTYLGWKYITELKLRCCPVSGPKRVGMIEEKKFHHRFAEYCRAEDACLLHLLCKLEKQRREHFSALHVRTRPSLAWPSLSWLHLTCSDKYELAMNRRHLFVLPNEENVCFWIMTLHHKSSWTGGSSRSLLLRRFLFPCFCFPFFLQNCPSFLSLL